MSISSVKMCGSSAIDRQNIKKKTSEDMSGETFLKSEPLKTLDADLMKDLSKSLSGVKSSEINIIERLARPMSEDEKINFKECFPNMDVEHAVVTAEATPEYNCIAWTVGETHQWFWPPSMYPGLSEEKAFDKFYGSYGLKQAPQGEVARWRNKDGITHGCISGKDHGPTWESKCGQELRVQHTLHELEGDIYGKPDAFYTKEGVTRTMPPYKPVELSDDIKAEVKKKADNVSPEIKEKFENSYGQWLEYRKEPKIRLSGNPKDFCNTESFSDITNMGTSVVPLLMEKMSEGDFFCLQALESIGKTTRSKEMKRMELSNQDRNNSEQNKASLVLMKWIE